MKACLSHPEQHYNSSMVSKTALESEKWISKEQARDVEKEIHGRLRELGSTQRGKTNAMPSYTPKHTVCFYILTKSVNTLKDSFD